MGEHSVTEKNPMDSNPMDSASTDSDPADSIPTYRHNSNDTRRFILLAVGFELALGAIAVTLGWLTGPLPWATLESLDQASLATGTAIGVLTAMLLFAGLVLLDRKPIGIFRQLQRTVQQQVAPLFRGMSIWGFMVIALAAGFGEELLFRGYVQAALAQWFPTPWGSWCALLLASALFGICHWISSAYASIAAAMGLLLGGLFLATGDLLAPIIAHTLYDFLALLYLTRQTTAIAIR